MPISASGLAGWPLPPIGLGTGTWYFQKPGQREQVEALVRHVLAGPRPFFDTAPLYGNGTSETWLGRALRGAPRASFVLASKAGYTIAPGAPPRTELARDAIFRSVEGSLQRLGVEYLDICHVHDPDGRQQEALDSALPALCELRDQGVIRAVGAGMNQWEMPVEFARHADVDCFLLAGRYTLLEQGGLPLLDLCLEKGIALFPAGVFNSGILVTGPIPGARYNYDAAPPAVLERARRLEAVCARHAVALPAAALQFAAAHPAVRALIVGANSIDEYENNRAAFQAPLAPALWDDLRAQGLLRPEAPLPRPANTH